ncbi:MAG: hypothetical protein ACMXX6_00125 [Candidatus Woesearchaeota archaeon]
MDKKKVVETLFDKKVIKILRLFINNPNNQYYLREISRISKVSPASTHRILSSMKDLNLIKERKEKHLKTYILFKENASIFSELLEDRKSALQEFSSFIKGVSGVLKAIRHGEEQNDKASVLIVGRDIDQELIRQKVFDIKQKFNFNLIFLTLDPDQYIQMESMGLYPGKKEILFEKT